MGVNSIAFHFWIMFLGIIYEKKSLALSKLHLK